MLPADLKKLQHLSELFSTGAANATDLKTLSELLSFLKLPGNIESQDSADIKRSA